MAGTVMSDRAMLSAAIEYAERLKWRVLPLWPVRRGLCACGVSGCSNPGKHPLGPLVHNGVHGASTNVSTITSWWSAWPDANIGLAAGDDWWALDVDGPAGAATLDALVDQFGPLPETVIQQTGKGRHFLFAMNGVTVRNRVKLRAGLDTRSSGGLIVAEPSRHISGSQYVWEVGTGPYDVPIALPPSWLLDLITSTANTTGYELPAQIKEGERNARLASLAGSMRSRGATADEILAAITAVNHSRCRPPLDDFELRKIAESIARYEPQVVLPEPEIDVSQLIQPAHLDDAPPVSDLPLSPERHAPDGLITDLGNARRLARRHGHLLRWSPASDWLYWTREVWVPDEARRVYSLAKEIVDDLLEEVSHCEDENERERLMKSAVKCQAAPRINALPDLLRCEPGIYVNVDALDRDPYLLNCRNGTVDLRTGALRPHDRSDLLTKLAAVAFDDSAPCPTWTRFLERIFGGDRDLIEFVQRLMGYCATGSIREQILAIFHGGGQNGKSTLLEAVRRVLGEYVGHASTNTFMAQDRASSEVGYDLARLRGCRLVTVIESGEGRRLNEELIKQATGGDPIAARAPYRQGFTYVPTFKLLIAANHRPRVTGTDFALWRRLRLVPFDVTVPPEERDPLLLEKLLAESEGILAWIVQGAVSWNRDGLQAPDRVRVATEAYRSDQDVVQRFVDECCEKGAGLSEPARDLYAAFMSWAREGGESEVSTKRFGTRLGELGLTPSKSGSVRFWLGIRLRPPAEDAA